MTLDNLLYNIAPQLASKSFIERVRAEARDREKWKLMCWNVYKVSNKKRKWWQLLFD